MKFRSYLRDFDGRVPEETKTITSDFGAALSAFGALVGRTDLDGKQFAAVLTLAPGRQIAFHRFDRHPGDADYWRDKLDQIEAPVDGRGGSRLGAGRPSAGLSIRHPGGMLTQAQADKLAALGGWQWVRDRLDAA